MSATLTLLTVLMFSGRLVVAFARLTAVGASFTSVIVSMKSAVAGVLPARAGSLTETVTAYVDLASWSRLAPDFR